MKKYKAYQVAPEHQESPMNLYHEIDDFAIIDNNKITVGNAEIKSIWDIAENEFYDMFEICQDVLTDMTNVSDDMRSVYEHATEEFESYFYLKEYIYPALSQKDFQKLSYDYIFEVTPKAIFKDLAEIILGDTWSTDTIRGFCQGDYATIIYNERHYDKTDINYIESAYFNMGIEFNIEYGDDTIAYYLPEWNGIDNAKQQIANCFYNVKPYQIELYLFDGYEPKYKIV